MKKALTFGVGAALFALGTWAHGFTVATFADPAVDGSTPLFEITDTTIDAGWAGLGLTLEIPGNSTQYTDVTFVSTTIARSGMTFGAGSIQFKDSGGSDIFKIEFDSGTILEPYTSGASTMLGDNVTFSGSAIAGLNITGGEQFAFSFANQDGTAAMRTYTAAFTSSAVPEPTTIGLLGLGGAALVRLRKRRKLGK